jgi:chromosome partitioning protein
VHLEKTRVLAVSNQKGGVGKTTTAINLGTALAAIGQRVLIVDMDPQGNASTGLGVPRETRRTTIYDVVVDGRSVEDAAVATTVPGLHIIPADADMSGVEIELSQADRRSYRLRDALSPSGRSTPLAYDYVLIDCPPSLGLLTVNGLTAANEVIVPIQCQYYALEGLGQLLRNVDLVSRNLNPGLGVSTIICTMFDTRTKLSSDVVNEVREHFGDKVCQAVIPHNVRLAEAPSHGKPITTFDPTSTGAKAYRAVALEVSGGAPERAR